MKTIALPTKTLWRLACAAALLAGGCDSPAESPPESESATCSYDFQVNITAGTNAGTSYHGSLLLAEDTASEGGGLLTLDDGTKIPVVSALKDGLIHLQFVLPTGEMLRGSGPHTGSLASCAADVKGEAQGPATDDTGDWSAIAVIRAQCALNCSFQQPSQQTCINYCTGVTAGGMGAQYDACLNDCATGIGTYVCTGNASTTFFPICNY